MNSRKRILVLAAWMLAFYPLAAQTGSVPDEKEENRRKLERLKDKPEDLAKVRNKAIYFLSLPEERRAQLLDLDQKLHKQPLTARKRLGKVLERYTTWLESLDENQRKKIKDAPGGKTRLEIIKTMRAEEWLTKQPEARQKELAKLDPAKRAARIRALRDQERRQKNHWIICTRFWDDLNNGRPLPARLTDFDGDMVSFFNEYLLPRLDATEKDRLKKAEGHWPHYPLVLVTIADRHPSALPDPHWPRKFDDLPRDVKKRITRGKKGEVVPMGFVQLAKQQGLAKAVSLWTMKKGNPLPHELFAHNLSCMSEPVKIFVAKKLLPELSKEELLQWNSAEGWPKFPLTLKKLAEDHDLQVPWRTLPGNPEIWDKYRLKQRLQK